MTAPTFLWCSTVVHLNISHALAVMNSKHQQRAL